MKPAPKVFLSYAHEDVEFAHALADTLTKGGLSVWFDKWDIRPGDSIVQRIFEHGLRDAALFAVVLSKSSVESRWVREELDAATIRRIEGVVRVVPILKEDCDVPLSLRALRWIDMRRGMEPGVRDLINVAFGISSKPNVGPEPPVAAGLSASVGGLSRIGSTLGKLLLELENHDEGFPGSHQNRLLHDRVQCEPVALNDAVEELEEHGLVKVLRTLGTAPYHFWTVTPTYALYLHFAESLAYDPQQDVRIVAAAIVALDTAMAEALAKETRLSPGRLNRAVQYLDDYGLVDSSAEFGTAPFDFRYVRANRRTREFVEEAK